MKRYAVSPVNWLNIKKGKKYLITKWESYKGRPVFFHIIDDDEYTIHCRIGTGCPHLHGAEWTITEEKEPSDDN